MQNNVGEIFENNKQKLSAFIGKRVSDKEEAEDILQEAFRRLAEEEETDPVTMASSWLYRVIRNLIVDNRRKKREDRLPETAVLDEDEGFVRDFTEVLIDEDQSPEREYLKNLIWEELETALDELPKEQKYVFEKTELDGVSFKELSRQSNILVKTLLSRKHYAVLYLRKQLREVYEAFLEED